MKYTDFVLTVIAVCLVYFAFIKPLPQRYQSKEEKEEREEEVEAGRVKIINTKQSVFDTATGKEYVYTIYQSTQYSNDPAQNPKVTIIPNNFVLDHVHNRAVHRTEVKQVIPDDSVLGKRRKEIKEAVAQAQENK